MTVRGHDVHIILPDRQGSCEQQPRTELAYVFERIMARESDENINLAWLCSFLFLQCRCGYVMYHRPLPCITPRAFRHFICAVKFELDKPRILG